VISTLARGVAVGKSERKLVWRLVLPVELDLALTSLTLSLNPLRKAREAYSRRMEVLDIQSDCALGALKAKAVPKEDFGSAPSSEKFPKIIRDLQLPMNIIQVLWSQRLSIDFWRVNHPSSPFAKVS